MEFQLLGPVEATHHGHPVDLGRRRERCLLALLLLEAGNAVPADRLIALLWEDALAANPRAALQISVSRLRRRLDPDGGQRHGFRLVTVGNNYLAEVDRQCVDAHRFRTLVNSARVRADPAERATMLREALALWRGPVLADVASDSLRERVGAELTELRLIATELAVDAELVCGRAVDLIGELSTLVAEHPLRERFTAQLMLALYRSGRHPEALDAYAVLRDRLADELGVDPRPELQRMHTAVLRHDPELAGTSGRRRSYLPAANSDFTGRDAEVDTLLANADEGAAAVVAIDGMGGIGKTALAVQVAHRLSDRYPDGQLFLNLHGHTEGQEPTNPVVALGILLRALGVPGEQLPAGLDERAARWRAETAGRRVLLLLDNAAAAAQVRPLLPGSPRALTVVTSRRRLTALDPARTLSLDALPARDAAELFARVVADGRPGAEPDAVADVVAMCGRLPLAVRIAAARLRHRPRWTVAYLAQRLRDERRRLDELVTEDRGVAAAFALSYHQLGDAHRRMFRCLGLGPGVDLDRYAAAATANTGLDEAEALLEDLVDVHLLQASAPGRYTFHDLIRQYARQRAGIDECELENRDAVTRLLDYYLSVADDAAALVDDRWHRVVPLIEHVPKHASALADRDAALEWLEQERANLGEAVRFALDDGRLTFAWQLPDTLFRFYFVSGHFDDLVVTHQAGLDATCRLRDRHAEATLANRLAIGHHHCGRYAEALQLLQRAWHLREELGLRESVAGTRNNIALVCEVQGRYAVAVDHLEEALAIYREAGDRQMEGTVLNNLGTVSDRLGHHEVALDYNRQALAIARELGDGWNEAIRLTCVGRVLSHMGRHSPALTLIEQSLTLIRETADRSFEAAILYDLGVVQGAAGQRALDTLRQALDLARLTANRYTEARALIAIADLDPDATTARATAMAIFTELGVPEAKDLRDSARTPP